MTNRNKVIQNTRQPTSQVPVYVKPRAPTTADIKDIRTNLYYEIPSFWIINKDKQSGIPVASGNLGDIYWLADIASNLADWRRFDQTGGLGLDDLRDQVNTAIGPSGTGFIDLDGLAVANGANPSGVPLETVKSGTANTMDFQIQVAAARTGAPANKNDAGLSSYNDNHFTVDTDGYVSIKSQAGLFWVEETTTTRALLVNQGVVGNNAGTITMTLPASAAFGDVIKVTQKGAGLVRVAQNAGQTIHFGTTDSTTGVGGYIESSAQWDAVTLLCVTANTDFQVLDSVGTWNVA